MSLPSYELQVSLADKLVKELTEELDMLKKPRPMHTAPLDVDIYLVHRHTEDTIYGSTGEFATTLGRWGSRDNWWYGRGGYNIKPVGWYPVPHAKDAEALECEGAEQ